MKIIDIILYSNKCEILFDNNESAQIWQFGKTLYSSTSRGNAFKESLKDLKNDINKYGFTEEFRKLWI